MVHKSEGGFWYLDPHDTTPDDPTPDPMTGCPCGPMPMADGFVYGCPVHDPNPCARTEEKW